MTGYATLFVFGIALAGIIIVNIIRIHKCWNEEIDVNNVPPEYAEECKKIWEDRIDYLMKENRLEKLRQYKGKYNKMVIREILKEKEIDFEI